MEIGKREDFSGGALQDDASLQEYFDTFRPSRFGPEKELMQAVLERAIKDFRENLNGGSAWRERLFRDAERWIFGHARSRDEDWVFSFENVCAHLGLDAGRMRRGLLRYKNGRPVSQAASCEKEPATRGKWAAALRKMAAAADGEMKREESAT